MHTHVSMCTSLYKKFHELCVVMLSRMGSCIHHLILLFFNIEAPEIITENKSTFKN